MKNMQRCRDDSTFLFTNTDKSTERDAKKAEMRIFMIDFSAAFEYNQSQKEPDMRMCKQMG